MTRSPDNAPSAFQRFFNHESAGGVVLGLAALAALVLSNSPAAGWYEALIHAPGELVFGKVLVLEKSLLVWVNDLWMAVFFFLVGLEIKREFVEGELADRRQAVLPLGAALGGMAVPALIYSLVNWGDGQALQGWAIPAATDIAFAIGIVMLLGSRVPVSLKVFLSAVAIIDDLGAILVIAAFYTDKLSVTALAGAAAGLAVLFALNRLRVTRVDVYAAVGLVIWVFVLKSGVHATLAGVLTAMAIPTRDAQGGSPLQRVEHGLHPWVAFLILPVFGFCNAGVNLAGASLESLLAPVPLGIAMGLVLGKVVGVFGTSWLMVRSGLGAAPTAATTLQWFGVCVLCGIGFTMSLFIGGLAFEGLDPAYETQLKLGVLAGSAVAALAGSAILVLAARLRRAPA